LEIEIEKTRPAQILEFCMANLQIIELERIKSVKLLTDIVSDAIFFKANVTAQDA
jgi:hypothetical protein